MACARYFGCVPSAVSNWLATNRIPDRYHLRLKAQLEARGYDVDVHALGWLSRRDTRPDVECFM